VKNPTRVAINLRRTDSISPNRKILVKKHAGTAGYTPSNVVTNYFSMG
jgi:hypothetical protein